MRAHLSVFIACAAALAVRPAPARAQRLAVETIADLELWKTDDSSRLVARDGGRLALEARLHAWVAWRPMSSLELRVLGSAQAGRAESEHSDAYLELLAIRYFPRRAFVVEAGKLLLPIGAFGPRRFSNTNPLIGAPDTYPAEYPFGVIVSGAVGAFDYRGGVISLPAVNQRYSPEPDHRLRGVGGIGISVGPRFRIGAAYTHGPYLGDGVTPQIPAGRKWDDYQQSVLATDARFSAGYVEARVEAAWSRYDAPTVAAPLEGRGWYGEVRATLSPRVFVAARYEDFAYPFILPVNPFFWVGSVTTQRNAEAGVGYRLTADALIKASLRKDHWPVHAQGDINFPDGYAFAMQFSLHTDVLGLFARKY